MRQVEPASLKIVAQRRLVFSAKIDVLAVVTDGEVCDGVEERTHFVGMI